MNSQRTEKGKNGKKKNNSVFTSETFGVVLVLFATLLTVCLLTGEKVFSVPGGFIASFLYGTFGYFAYFVCGFAVYRGIVLVTGKKPQIKTRRKLMLWGALILFALFVHIVSMGGYSSYGEYLSASYLRGEGGFATSSGGGLVVGLVGYFLQALLTPVGSAVITAIGFSAVAFFYVKDLVKDKTAKTDGREFRSTYVKNQQVAETETAEETLSPQAETTNQAPAPAYAEKPSQRLFVNDGADFAFKTKKDYKEGGAVRVEGKPNSLNVSSYTGTYSQMREEEMKKKIEYVKTPAKIEIDNTVYSAGEGETTVSDYISRRVVSEIPLRENSADRTDGRADVSAENEKETPLSERNRTVADIPMIEHGSEFGARTRAQEFGARYVDPVPETDADDKDVTETAFTRSVDHAEKDGAFSVVGEDDTISAEIDETEERIDAERESNAVRNLFAEEKPAFTSRAEADGNARALFAEERTQNRAEQAEEEREKPKPPINRTYYRPPLDLLESHTPPADAPKENHEENMEIIRRVLEDFHINVEPQGQIQGPTITRYQVKMPAGISVKKVLGYDDDLKMRLQSKAGVRIEAPVPGMDLVGIEVANKTKITVGLREIMEDAETQKSKPGALMFAVGKDIVGNSKIFNLAKGPHYLVAGATGSGKSVCLNVMIVSMIMRYSPEDLRLILIDPKRVGFRKYEHLPHLMIDEIITEPQKAVNVLQWAYNEMERRYDEFAKTDGGLVSDIESYNEIVASDTVPKMPRIVIVVDELADLMETCKKDMDAKIRLLAQKARAAGIHLVLATQRPSVDVITGTIKANLPSRIALKVMNFADSSTILSEGGAEKLLGNGDMLFKDSGMSETERYQGAWISDREISNIVNYIREKNAAYYDDDLKTFLEKSSKPKQEETAVTGGDEDEGDGLDDFFLKALWLAVTMGSVSISQLQRRFQIGYARAGGLVDKMERLGFVSGNEGSKARRTLITREEYENRFGAGPEV